MKKLLFNRSLPLWGSRKGLVLAVMLLAAGGLSSCNATRTITTKSEYWQKGDTSCVIQTRTIESYDASKK